VAHAAIADPKRGRLIHEERAARAGFTLAHAETERTGVWIDDWRLVLEGDKYHSQIAAREFDLDLTFSLPLGLYCKARRASAERVTVPGKPATTTAAPLACRRQR